MPKNILVLLSVLSALGTTAKSHLKEPDLLPKSTNQLFTAAVEHIQADFTPFLHFNNLPEIQAAAYQWNTFANQTSPKLQQVITPSNYAEAVQITAVMQSQFGHIVGQKHALQAEVAVIQKHTRHHPL